MFFFGLNVLDDLLLNKKLILLDLELKIRYILMHHCCLGEASTAVICASLFSVYFLVSSIGCTHECPLKLALLLFSELIYHPYAELLDLVHGFLRILTSQELNVPEGVSETDLKQCIIP